MVTQVLVLLIQALELFVFLDSLTKGGLADIVNCTIRLHESVQFTDRQLSVNVTQLTQLSISFVRMANSLS